MRSLQIDELIRKELKQEPIECVPRLLSRRRSVGELLLTFAMLSSREQSRRLEDVVRVWRSAVRSRSLLDLVQKRNVEKIIWEDTTDYAFGAALLRLGARVIAAPHNVESMTGMRTAPYDSRGGAFALKKEMGYLSRCDACFSIANEDAWLIRNYGIDAHVIPYLPPQCVANRCVPLRAARRERSNRNHDLMLLGTATNPPTRAGMAKFLMSYRSLARNNASSLLVVGWGTETFKEFDGDGITILGGVSQARLDELVVAAKGVVVAQSFGTGALTRIPELLAAGVPILCNEHAARGQMHFRQFLDVVDLDQLPSMAASWQPRKISEQHFDNIAQKVAEANCQQMAKLVGK